MFDHLSVSLVLFCARRKHPNPSTVTFVVIVPPWGGKYPPNAGPHFKPKAPSSRTRFEIPKGTDLHMLLGFDKTRGRQWRNDAMTLARLTMTLRKGTVPPVNEKTSRNQGTTAGHFITFPQHETFIPQCLGAHCWTMCTLVMGTCLRQHFCSLFRNR